MLRDLCILLSPAPGRQLVQLFRRFAMGGFAFRGGGGGLFFLGILIGPTSLHDWSYVYYNALLLLFENCLAMF